MPMKYAPALEPHSHALIDATRLNRMGWRWVDAGPNSHEMEQAVC